MELLQIVRYDQGGFFIEHYDAGGIGNVSSRLYTFLIYLNNVEEGGETTFTKINEIIKPEKGSCVIFKSTINDIILNKSAHKAEIVKVGYKCICTKWVHSRKLIN
jgi:prolyl 4-hydroxylase